VVRLISVLLVSAVATSAAAQTQTSAPTAATAPTSEQTPAPPNEQTPSPPPKKVEHREPPQTMVLTMSMSGGVADDLVNGSGSSTVTTTGFHTDADALLTYQRRLGRGTTTIGVTGRSVYRYAAAIGAVAPMHDQGEFVVSRVAARSLFRAAQSVTYSPNYQFGAVPGAVVTPIDATAQSHGDFANSDLAALSSVTSIDLGRTVSRRNALSMSYNLERTTFDDQNLNWTYQKVSGRLVHRLTRSMSLRTGYGFLMAESAFTKTGSARSHAVDVGLDYSRPLSSTRSTTLNFSSGYAATPYDQGTAYHMTGEAAVTREIGRTLRARLAVNRSVQLIEGFTQPTLMNSIASTFSGSLGRRASLSTSVGFSGGTVGVDARDGNNYANWMGAVGLHLTLNRRASVNAQYSSYHHRFDPGVQLAPGMTNRLNRQGVRVSLTWLAPLLQ
jgi:hypothetical protein